MCGIIGAVSQRDISKVLIEGLYLLEYRGYDSAGLALIDPEKKLKRLRVEGKVKKLAQALEEITLEGQSGIAHTRWATHGKPCEENAHPHLSNNEIALVHNGIIENHEPLKQELTQKGYFFTSETDTEVAAHLIHDYYQQGFSLLEAVQKAAYKMEGSFALGVIHQNHPEELVAVRKGSPLIIGIGKENEHFIASDVVALHAFVHSFIYLEDGDSVCLRTQDCQIYDNLYQRVERPSQQLSLESQGISKGNYRHYMQKEIYEQPKALKDTFSSHVENKASLAAGFGQNAAAIFEQVQHIHIVACGTSYHAGLVAKYWLESLTGLATQVEVASEYRYRSVVVPAQTLFIAISQSGETADTLAALQKAKTRNYLSSLVICNRANSTLVQQSDLVFLTQAGIEIGVASTKAFTTQLTALLMLTAALAPNSEKTQEILEQIKCLPQYCEQALKMDEEIKALASRFVSKKHALFLGRGAQYPVSLEGALKLKEISYIHAEAYPAGELKHGPLALIDKEMPVIAIAPNNELLEKLKSNLHEVSARGGQLIVFGDSFQSFEPQAETVLLAIPSCGAWIAPIIYVIPLQLLAYHVAVAKGTDVDQPRNLAKSVTVE